MHLVFDLDALHVLLLGKRFNATNKKGGNGGLGDLLCGHLTAGVRAHHVVTGGRIWHRAEVNSINGASLVIVLDCVFDVGLARATSENLNVSILVWLGQLQHHVWAVVFRNTSLDRKPVQFGRFSHGYVLDKETREVSVRQAVQGNANVIGNSPVVPFSRGDMLPGRGINECAVEVIGGFLHQRAEFIVRVDGINSYSSFVVHSKDFIEGSVQVVRVSRLEGNKAAEFYDVVNGGKHGHSADVK